jgi:hypothetical protein
MKLICIKSYGSFKSGEVYNGEKRINNKQTYSNGNWYNHEYIIDSVVGQPGYFKTLEEWRELQLNKVLV